MALDRVDVEPPEIAELEHPDEGVFSLRNRFDIAVSGVRSHIAELTDRVHHIHNGEHSEEFLEDHHNPERYQTEFGSVHDVRIYNPQFMYGEQSKTPLVHLFPLAVRDDHGIEMRKLGELAATTKWQRRSVITISSEGFAKQLSPRQLKNLTPEQCARNVHSVLDGMEQRHGYDLSTVIFSGASRGGTYSYLAADREIAGDRHVAAVIPVAGPGFKQLSPLDMARAGFQFGFVEPAYMARRAMGRDKFREDGAPHYLFRLIGTAPSPRALPAIVRTGVNFLTTAPLTDIRDRMHPDTEVYDLLLESDGITRRESDDEVDGFEEIEEALVVAGIHMHCTEGRAIDHIIESLAKVD